MKDMSTNAQYSANDDPLKRSAQYLKGVGPARFELLKRLGVETVGDLLYLFPRSYEDLSDLRPIAELVPDRVQTVIGAVVEMDSRRSLEGRSILSIVLTDGQKVIEGVWFNQAYIARQLHYGQRVAFSGKVQWYRDHWQMSHPRVQVLERETEAPTAEALVLPVYPLTEGLRAEQVRRIVRPVVEQHAGRVTDLLPAEIRKRRRLPALAEALHDMHLPASIEAATRARRRLVYEEFLILQLGLALRRREHRDRLKAPPLPITKKIDAHIRRLFPFALTRDQDRAVDEICTDLGSDRPMQRLLQADVGAGKTAVAVYALLLTVAHQHQAVLMAPTEVLVRQHWRTINQYLAHSRVRRLLLSGALTPKERRVALSEIKAGNVDLVVGTQALIQNDVTFHRLGLVVIDEQHRFGVEQRAQVRRLGGNLRDTEPHYLILTATPIPRTMALTVFGDLDVSVIRQLPPGRKPVITRAVQPPQRAKLEERLRAQLRTGRQLYVVCPLVEESENTDIKAAEKTYDELRSGAFRDFRVGLLHGRLDEKEKDRVMGQFRARELDVLVTTLVIEVGVDVPNATLMVIEHADRFGLSQLHQLRGRITRGTIAGECYIFADAGDNEETKRRLRMFTRTTDGFLLAEEDARIRGMGQFFGTRQHGLGELRLGHLTADADLLTAAREDAFSLVAADPGLKDPAHAGLKKSVLDKYGATLKLAEIG